MMEFFYENSYQFITVNYFCKKNTIIDTWEGRKYISGRKNHTKS